MKWNFWDTSELEERNAQLERYASYQDTLTNLVIAQAQGNLLSRAEQTAAVEFGVGLLERCFMVADVMPEFLSRVTITPMMLSRMVRGLILTGNSVSAIDTASGELLLHPASNYDIRGGIRERSWRYRVELSGPSSTTVRRLPSASVVHVRMGSSVQTPWRGCSPLLNAGLSASLLGRIENKMTKEANMKVGAVIPFPEESDVSHLQRDLAVEGKLSFVPTTAGGHGAGMRASPREDWQQKRLGPHFPESNIALRSDAAHDIIAAMGIPAPLFRGTDGVSAREAYRLLLVSTLQPLADIIAAELSRKLELGVSITFRRLHAADIASRARAFGSMIAAGVEEETARQVSGLTM